MTFPITPSKPNETREQRAARLARGIAWNGRNARKLTEAQERYRLRHPGRVAQKAQERRANNRLLIAGAKNVPCLDCGNRYPPECMDFDHVGEKAYAISDMMKYSEKKILDEIAKCEVVCSNCHRVRTMARRRASGLPY